MKITKEFANTLVGLEVDVKVRATNEVNEFIVTINLREISDEGLEALGLDEP